MHKELANLPGCYKSLGCPFQDARKPGWRTASVQARVHSVPETVMPNAITVSVKSAGLVLAWQTPGGEGDSAETGRQDLRIRKRSAFSLIKPSASFWS